MFGNLLLLFYIAWYHYYPLAVLLNINYTDTVSQKVPLSCQLFFGHIFKNFASKNQGSHASWKVLDFFFKILGPGMSWKNILESYEFLLVLMKTSRNSKCPSLY